MSALFICRKVEEEEKQMETMVMKNRKKWRETGLDILGDFAGALLQAIGVWCFIEPSRIAPGGVSGIALMIKHLFG